MAPRKDYGPATRRSARTRSVSVSSAGDAPQDAARVTKAINPKKAAKAPAAAWGVASAIERILGGDRQYILRLTHEKRAAIINAFADRELQLQARLEEAESANEQLIQERDRALAQAKGKPKLSMFAWGQQQRIDGFRREIEAKALEQQAQPTTQAEESAQSPAAPITAEQVPVVQALTEATTLQSPAIAEEVTVEQALTVASTPQSPAANNTGVQDSDLGFTLDAPLSAPQATSTPLFQWKKYLTSVGGLFSPLKRFTSPTVSTPTVTKRPAPDDEESETPSAKRARTDMADEQTGETPSAKRARTDETDDQDSQTPSAKRARTVKPSPQKFLGPSAKNRRVPTSLSTINEFTEPGNSTFIDPTPSKPPQQGASLETPVLLPPQQRALFQTPVMQPQKRPAPLSAPAAVSAPAPSSESVSTPSQAPHPRRTIASVRAARKAREAAAASKTPKNNTPYAWEQKATPKPAMADTPIADRRVQKMQQLNKVRRQLEELQQDEDVVEMESHRRKRVKVDDLEVIPHNLPGDSAGTFRVPDWDSDEEMEVDESVSVRTNVFVAQQAEEDPAADTPPAATIIFNFPSVGLRRPEHDIIDEQEEKLVFNFPCVGLRQ